MRRRPPRSTLTDTLCPYTTLFRSGKVLGVEAALGARWDDDGVLHHLGLHQPEHLGAEIVAAIGPADAAARHRSAAKVDSFHPWLIDEDFPPRHGPRKPVDRPAVELDRQRLRPAGNKGIAPDGRADDRPTPSHPFVLVAWGNY